MVTRLAGAPRQGYWFGSDIRVLFLDITNAEFLADLTVTSTDPRQDDVVNSGLEQVIEVVQSRCTIIAMNVTGTKTVEFLIDYGAAFTVGNTQDTSGSVEEELAAAISAIDTPQDLNGPEIQVFASFAGAVLGTPT
jgi:hypothetical protein